MNYVKETISNIINNILGVAVDKDKACNKLPIVSDDGWNRRTTGDLEALLDNLGPYVLQEAIECERCDKRFTNTEELKLHEAENHRLENDYELLCRKHDNLTNT